MNLNTKLPARQNVPTTDMDINDSGCAEHKAESPSSVPTKRKRIEEPLNAAEDSDDNHLDDYDVTDCHVIVHFPTLTSFMRKHFNCKSCRLSGHNFEFETFSVGIAAVIKFKCGACHMQDSILPLQRKATDANADAIINEVTAPLIDDTDEQIVEVDATIELDGQLLIDYGLDDDMVDSENEEDTINHNEETPLPKNTPRTHSNSPVRDFQLNWRYLMAIQRTGGGEKYADAIAAMLDIKPIF